MSEAKGDIGGAGLRLTCFDRFPDELLRVPAWRLWQHLEGPSLFRIAGRRPEPLFVSVLLHGNEHTGWQAVQSVLERHAGTQLPRSLLLFVANIAAAKVNARTLPTQTDYNRAWPGTTHLPAPETALMKEVFETVSKHTPYASIDIHNNTGNNPHYACVTSLDDRYLHLARLFSRTVVYFEKPVGVQSAALAAICPAVTIECGRTGAMAGVYHATEFVASALAISQLPEHPLPSSDIDLLRTFAIIKVPREATMSFDGSNADFRFRADLDRLNFSEIEKDTSFGALGGDRRHRLSVLPGDDVATVESYFDYSGDQIRVTQRTIPAMLTVDPSAVRLDSLGYLMHRIDRKGRRVG
jgi:succinylglutamate desuccinylase